VSAGDAIAVSIDGAVARVTLNRPERRNALDATMWEQLGESVEALRDRADLRCLVLTGAGGCFAAGGDLTSMLAELEDPEGPSRFRDRVERCTEGLATFPAPTVAMVNGPAVGGGLELAAACDVRVAAPTATFVMPAARFAIVMAASDFARLASIVGIDQARYLTITAQEVDAAEARRIGLVHILAGEGELEAATDRVTRRLMAMDAEAVAWFRRAARSLAARHDDPGLARHEVECLVGSEFQRRVDAFLAR
jgi:enoyl-CoA hydratase/carnithine racemase